MTRVYRDAPRVCLEIFHFGDRVDDRRQRGDLSAIAARRAPARFVCFEDEHAEPFFGQGVARSAVPCNRHLTGRRLSMIEKWASSRKVSLDEAKQALLAHAGIARYGEPRDIAELIAFLVSPAAQWMTGTQLRIDGGEVKSV